MLGVQEHGRPGDLINKDKITTFASPEGGPGPRASESTKNQVPILEERGQSRPSGLANVIGLNSQLSRQASFSAAIFCWLIVESYCAAGEWFRLHKFEIDPVVYVF